VLLEFRDVSVQKQASTAAQRAADWHHALLQHTADGICIFDDKLAVLETNERFAAMLGYTTAEMRGMHPWDWDINLSQTDLNTRFLLQPGNLYTIETRHRRKDGSLYDAEVRIHFARIDDRTVGISVERDISERKRIERQLQQARDALESERGFLKTLVRTIPNLVWLKDPEGVYLACNAEFERFFGHPECEIVGKSDYDFMDRDLAEFFRDHDRAAMAAGKPTVNEEWITYASDGHRAFLMTTKTPMYRPDGSVIGVLGVAQDITAQQRAAHELAQSQALLRSVLDAVPVRIFWKDRNSRYLGCNPLFAEDAGKATPDELLGKLDNEMGWAAQADLYRADDRQVMESGLARLNFEEPQTTPDGRTIFLSTSKVPLRDEKGNVFGVLGIYDDVTERKQTETQLKESEERFRTVFNQSPVSILIHDKDDGSILDANQTAWQAYGLASLDALKAHDIWLEPPYSQADAMAWINKAAEAPQATEWKSRKVTGEVFWELVTLDRKSTRLNSSHRYISRMPSSA
jgi:PAS domain S-box-containing protein